MFVEIAYREFSRGMSKPTWTVCSKLRDGDNVC